MKVWLYEDTVLTEIPLTEAQTLTEAGLTESLGERSLTVALTDILAASLAQLTLSSPRPPRLPSQPLAGRGTAGLGWSCSSCSCLALGRHQHLLVLVVEPGRDVGHVHEDAHRDVQVAGGGRGLSVRPDIGEGVVSSQSC